MFSEPTNDSPCKAETYDDRNDQVEDRPLPAKLIGRGESLLVVGGMLCLARTASSSGFAGSRGVGVFGVARQSTCRPPARVKL
jgi:hypothetical protein